MYEEFVQPNDITSFCNRVACSEADLMSEGMLYYPSMIITFGLAFGIQIHQDVKRFFFNVFTLTFQLGVCLPMSLRFQTIQPTFVVVTHGGVLTHKDPCNSSCASNYSSCISSLVSSNFFLCIQSWEA
jgi:hypothetical protein